MIKLVTALVVFGVCFAAPPPPAPSVQPEQVPIVSQISEIEPDGQYIFSFEAGDGTSQEQTGVAKVVDEKPVISVSGKYSYVDAEGVLRTITYSADETGYHAEGDTLPVAPPVPEPILKALKYIEENPYTEEERK